MNPVLTTGRYRNTWKRRGNVAFGNRPAVYSAILRLSCIVIVRFQLSEQSKAQDVFRAIVQLMSYSEVIELIRLLNMSKCGCQDILQRIDEKDRELYDL